MFARFKPRNQWVFVDKTLKDWYPKQKQSELPRGKAIDSCLVQSSESSRSTTSFISVKTFDRRDLYPSPIVKMVVVRNCAMLNRGNLEDEKGARLRLSRENCMCVEEKSTGLLAIVCAMSRNRSVYHPIKHLRWLAENVDNNVHATADPYAGQPLFSIQIL